MKTRLFLPSMACLLTACLLSMSANAKSKVMGQSQFCNDFATVALPDSATIFTSFADDKVLIRVFNNPTGFYLQLVAVDETTQQKLLFNGLTVYVDPTGKGKDKFAVIFPSMMSARQQGQLGGNNQDQPSMSPEQSNQDDGNQGRQRGQRHPDPLQMVQQINLKGATFDIDGDSRAIGIEWAKLSVTPDRRICYNIKLPYNLFAIKNLTPSLLSIGLLSEFTMPQSMQGGGGGMGGPGGDMGGPGGMGGHGGMGGPGGGMGGPGGGMGGPGGGMGQGSDNFRSRMTEMSKPVKGWILVQLDTQAH